MPETQIIFDTNCVLCSGFVHFIVARERDQKIVFVNAWSKTGANLAADHGMTENDLNETFLVIENDTGYTHSNAALKILAHLKAPWRWLRIMRLVPRPIRDWFYKIVARNRYRWFGFEQNCFIPSEQMRHRFID